MSHINNTIFLENAEQNFELAIDAGDYPTAKAVIDQLRNSGFDKDAAVLSEVLLDVPLNQFDVTVSPYA